MITLGTALTLTLVFAAGLGVCVGVLAAARWLYARIARDLSPFQRSAEALGARDRAQDAYSGEYGQGL